MTEHQKALYERNMLVDGFGEFQQELLFKASVLVVGAGGLGSPVLQYLTAAGVGRLVVVDDDVVSLSNLQRQVLYGVGDLGKRKVEVTRERLLAINPDLRFEGHCRRFDVAFGLEVALGVDVIMDCCDNYATRSAIDEVSQRLSIPFVYGSVEGTRGQVALFNYRGGIGYRDIFPTAPAPRQTPIGVLSPICGVVGSTQALECVKLLSGCAPTIAGTLITIENSVTTVVTLPSY